VVAIEVPRYCESAVAGTKLTAALLVVVPAVDPETHSMTVGGSRVVQEGTIVEVDWVAHGCFEIVRLPINIEIHQVSVIIELSAQRDFAGGERFELAHIPTKVDITGDVARAHQVVLALVNDLTCHVV